MSEISKTVTWDDVKDDANAIRISEYGFVVLKEVMGSDATIAESARVSYGDGTKKTSNDRALIRYLINHEHTSPLEMCEARFLISLPLFVSNQIVRHRSACLSGDNELWFDAPKSLKWKTKSGKHERSRYSISIKDFYEKWHHGSKPIPQRFSKKPVRFNMKERLKEMFLRSCDEDSKEIIHTHITNIWESGEKDVYEIELENGYKIKSSEDHLYFTSKGWKKLNDFTKINSETRFCMWDSDITLASNGIPPYADKDILYQLYWEERKTLSQIADKLGCSPHSIRKYLKKHNIQDTLYLRNFGVSPGNKGKTYKQNTSPERRLEINEKLKKSARRGKDNHFWRGGITPERGLICQWVRENAKKIHEKYNYQCVITGSKINLVAHHIVPVAVDPLKSRDIDNLITLCEEAHTKLHGMNLEKEFARWVEEKRDLINFFEENQVVLERPPYKGPKRSTRLVTKFVKIISIKYIGKEMTYDISVSGPYHNFISNGFVVHNSLNQLSGRYSIMPDEFFVPTELNIQSKDNKQGRAETVNREVSDKWAKGYVEVLETAKKHYDWAISEGDSMEQARIGLPLSQFTQMYWKMDLHNLMHFLRLRMDPHAQQETRDYANAIYSLLKPRFPIAMEAFDDYKLHAKKFSRMEIELLKKILGPISVGGNAKSLGMSDREIAEFVGKLS